MLCRSVPEVQTLSSGLRHPSSKKKVPEREALSVPQVQTPSIGLRHLSSVQGVGAEKRGFEHGGPEVHTPSTGLTTSFFQQGGAGKRSRFECGPSPNSKHWFTTFFAGKWTFECARISPNPKHWFHYDILLPGGMCWKASLRVYCKSCERPQLMWAALPFSLLCRTNARVARSVKFVSYGYTDNATGGKVRKGNETTNQKKPSYFLFKVFSHVILDWS